MKLQDTGKLERRSSLKTAGPQNNGSRAYVELLRTGQATRQDILHLQREAGNEAVTAVIEKAPHVPKRGEIGRLGKRQAGEPTYKKPKNESYLEAQVYVTQWFTEEAWVEGLLARMADDGFKLFHDYSDKDFNKDDAILLELFEVALVAVPAAGALLTAFKELSRAEKVTKLAEKVKRLTEVAIEPVEKVKATGKAIGEVGGSHESEEEKAKVEFEIETIKALSELNIKFVENRLASMHQLTAGLEALRDSSPSINLLDEVKGILGPKPKDAALEQAMEEARDKFELSLYRQFYVVSGRAYKLHWNHPYHGPVETIKAVPEKVMERITALTSIPGREWFWRGLRVEWDYHLSSGT
jgi:hypothetical protein